MSNNTYNNVDGGINVAVGGTTATSFATAVNDANIYGVTANVSSGHINIIYSVPGPIILVETDKIDTPLANAGITAMEYGFDQTSFVVTGTVANPTFSSASYFGLGINWNSILNSVSQSQRGPLKEIWIAQQERQKSGTPSYRILNVYVGTVSPVVGNPWEVSVSSYSFQDSVSGNYYTLTITNGTLNIATSTQYNSYGLLVFKDTATSEIYSISVNGANLIINPYLGSWPALPYIVFIDTATRNLYSMSIVNGSVTITEV